MSDVSLAPLPTRVEEVAQAIDVLVAAPGGAPIPLRQQGMGSRSLAALMVFQSFVEMRLGADLGLEPLALTALEEPEAHLHPQAQTAVASLLRDLPGQKIVSTHAARIATDAELDQVRFLRRDGATIRALRVFTSAWWGGRDPDGLGVAIPELQSLGGDAAQALVPALEDLGIPWLALVDGDDKGAKAVTQWEDRLERSLRDGTELVRLAAGQGFEKLLIDAGLQDQIAAGIRTYDPETLAALATQQGADETDDDVLLDALRKSKGTYGTPVATAIVDHTDDDGQLVLPPAIRELLNRADTILGTT